MGVSRSTFVIDTDGSLISVGYNVRASGHVDRLVKELGLEWFGWISHREER